MNKSLSRTLFLDWTKCAWHVQPTSVSLEILWEKTASESPGAEHFAPWLWTQRWRPPSSPGNLICHFGPSLSGINSWKVRLHSLRHWNYWIFFPSPTAGEKNGFVRPIWSHVIRGGFTSWNRWWGHLTRKESNLDMLNPAILKNVLRTT